MKAGPKKLSHKRVERVGVPIEVTHETLICEMFDEYGRIRAVDKRSD